MRFNRTLALALAAVAAVATPAAEAQTGTATTSPASIRMRPSALEIDAKEIDAVFADASAVLPDPIKAAAKKPASVNIDPRVIAEYGKAQARQLRDMQSLEAARSIECGKPDEIANDFRRAAVALSVADTEARWRAGVVRVQSAVLRLQDAATRSNGRPASCGLDTPEVAEATTIANNMRARGEVLVRALKQGFKPSFPQSDDAVSLLSALAVSQTEGTKQVGISPFDYFFSNHWRLYVRSTLVVDEEEAAGDDTSGEAASSDEPTPEDLADPVKLALLDPFGGPLNLSGGYFRKIPTPFLKGDANDLHHGLFADLRAGLKFVDLPEQKLKLVDGETRNTPFYQAAAAVRLILPVFKGAPGTDHPGGVEVAITGSWNRVADPGASDLFAAKDGKPALLERDTRNLHLAIKIDLPDVMSLQLSGTLWSNSKFDRRFLIGFGLNRKPKAAEPASATAEAEKAPLDSKP